jgi:hypothetical protein
MTVLYPIAANAEAALSAAAGRAARESAARQAAAAEVTFARELTGPAFESRAEAAAAYAGRLDEPGTLVAPEDRYCELQPVMARGSGPLRTVWRLCVSYWKIAGERDLSGLPQARQARRGKGAAVDPEAIGALAEQPLRPFVPQKALDIGLFEIALPENPGIIIADE